MKHIDLYNIKFSHIRIFLAAARYQSFTAAAEKLNLTQPFVSKVISHLEEELGLYLFVRLGHQIKITPAGKKLCEQWEMMMETFELSIQDAHNIQTGLFERLRIGAGELYRADNEVIVNICQLKEHCPGCEITLVLDNMPLLIDKLLHGSLDLIVISEHMLPMLNFAKYTCKKLMDGCLSVFVPKGNTLYERESVEIKDLRHQKFIELSGDIDQSHAALLNKLCAEAGFIPEISAYLPNAVSLGLNMELSGCIVLADNFCGFEGENIKRFDLDKRNDVYAVWNPSEHKKSIDTFLSLFRSRHAF